MKRERILITVRTYPNLSTKYTETVCTGGIDSEGKWKRLYPVQLRHLEDDKQFRTYDVVEVAVGDISPDGRPESRKPDMASLKVIEHIDRWQARVDWVLPTAVNSLKDLIDSGRTLAPVRVKNVVEFIADPVAAEWTAKQKDILRQMGLHEGPEPLAKLPYDFRLVWKDGNDVEHDSKFLAWEVGETWRVFRHRYKDDPISAVRRAFMENRFGPKNDLWFFMGNYAEHRQHFGVCGAFHPSKGSYEYPALF